MRILRMSSLTPHRQTHTCWGEQAAVTPGDLYIHMSHFNNKDYTELQVAVCKDTTDLQNQGTPELDSNDQSVWTKKISMCFDVGHVPWVSLLYSQATATTTFHKWYTNSGKCFMAFMFYSENNMQKFRGSLGLGKKCRNCICSLKRT